MNYPLAESLSRMGSLPSTLKPFRPEQRLATEEPLQPEQRLATKKPLQLERQLATKKPLQLERQLVMKEPLQLERQLATESRLVSYRKSFASTSHWFRPKSWMKILTSPIIR